MKTKENVLLSLIQGRPGYEFATGAIGWTHGSDACTWFGITCDDESGSVTGISLTGYKLEATLPSDLSELSTLEVISLSNCDIIGTIPSVVAEMSQLREIDLSLNQLTGTVPHFASTQLAVLSLPNNMLSGPMPILGHVERSNLITINLKNNQITGTIPPFSRSFPSLRHLDLSANELSGSLLFLESLQNQNSSFPSLERLYLSQNKLSGTLPPSFKELDTLKELHLQHNRFTGTIPGTMATLLDLQVLLLHDNRLTGEIPSGICDLNLNAEYFTSGSNFGQDNDDDGGIKRRRRLESALVIDERRDGCSSVACPSGFFSSTGQYPCEPCDDQRMNPYLGATICNHFNQEEILEIFYLATNGDMGWNSSLATPVCSRSGITCDDAGNVMELDFANRGLSGTLPPEIGFLPNLVSLDISHNSLSGNLPEELALPPLQTLILSENNISGYVPESLCQKYGVNENGVDGVLSCDRIACPMGTHHQEGHATPGKPCQPCPMVDGLVLANTDCRALTLTNSSDSDIIPQWSQLLLLSCTAAMLLLIGFFVLRKVETSMILTTRIKPCDLEKSNLK